MGVGRTGEGPRSTTSSNAPGDQGDARLRGGCDGGGGHGCGLKVEVEAKRLGLVDCVGKVWGWIERARCQKRACRIGASQKPLGASNRSGAREKRRVCIQRRASARAPPPPPKRDISLDRGRALAPKKAQAREAHIEEGRQNWQQERCFIVPA